jgi:hypothetical protein
MPKVSKVANGRGVAMFGDDEDERQADPARQGARDDP